MITLYSVIMTVIRIVLFAIFVIAIVVTVSKKESLRKKAKLWWLIFAISALAGASLYGWLYHESYIAEQKANAPVYLYTSEEEDALEDEITEYLEDLGFPESTLVSVYSGYTKSDGTEIVQENTRVHIFLSGRLAEDVSEGKTIAEGYGAAMTLYFGEREIRNYDIYVHFASKYQFLNGELVEEE